MHNTCEDSLLATPLIIDLVVICELVERISFRHEEGSTDFERLHSVLSILSYMLKAPLVPSGTPVVNALFAQRECMLNIFRACLGLPAENHMQLENKIPSIIAARNARKNQETNHEDQATYNKVGETGVPLKDMLTLEANVEEDSAVGR